MKIAVATVLVLVVFSGVTTYLAVAGMLIIYALGNNKATKRKRTIFSLLGMFMLWSAVYAGVWLAKYGNTIF